MNDPIRHLFVVDVKRRLINNTPYDVYRLASALPADEASIVDLRFAPLATLPESDQAYLFLETAGTWMCFDWNPSRFMERLDYLLPRCGALTVVGPQARALRELSGREFRVVDTLDFSQVFSSKGRESFTLTHPTWLGVDRNCGYNGQFFDGERMWLVPTFSIFHGMHCPLTCGFCYYAEAPRDAQIEFAALLDDVERMRAVGHRHFYFMDPNFLLNAERYARLAELYAASARRFSYYCQVSPNFLDPEHVARLAASGCRGMVIGIENREQILAKGDIVSARRRIDHVKAFGMMPTLYFMIDGRNDVVELIDEFEDVPFQYTVLNLAFAGDRSLASIVRGFRERARLMSQHAAVIEPLRARPNYIGRLAARADLPEGQESPS